MKFYLLLPLALTLFGCPKGGPSIIAISPLSVPAGSPAFRLRVDGRNLHSATVYWNGTPRHTSEISGASPDSIGASVLASIAATDVSVPGTASVSATTPAGVSNSATFTITVHPAPLVITTTSLPSATVGEPYSQQLNASGGIPPYSWAVTSGSLPPGLALSSSGLLSGTPAAAGQYQFVVTVTDSSGTAVAMRMRFEAPPETPSGRGKQGKKKS